MLLRFLCILAVSYVASGAGRARAAEHEDSAVRYEQGTALDRLPAAEARRAGATILDLSDAFVPGVLAEEPGLGELGYPPYANVYRALADERFDALPRGKRARALRYLELYGIPPTFSVLRRRLLDGARHACHAELDLAPLAEYAGPLSMASASRSAARDAATAALQSILRCDQLLASHVHEAELDYATVEALRAFQRQHMIVSAGTLDASTRAALLRPSLERDFEAVLRVLRERVTAAAGLIEDGSALGEQAEVVGRRLDAPELRATAARGPLPNGAPDLIGRATDAAARALGWTSPEATKAWFERVPEAELRELHVALRLPAVPAYHTEHMELHAEIDRGDVWYDAPYRADGSRRAQPCARRPTLVLYARAGDVEIALMRWNTTIGGFKPEQLADGRVVLRYKNSEPGPRVWREVIASPTWLPPDSTPDAELVRRVGAGRYALNREVFGPGFESAYGLVMMPHEVEWPASGRGQPSYADRGVRTHGSVNYRSILDGQSHGCHRLFNHLAMRLASFLVSHRRHVHHGVLPARYARTVRYQNVSTSLHIETRGYGYELTPPVPVLVMEGRILGHRKQPIEHDLPLPPGHPL